MHRLRQLWIRLTSTLWFLPSAMVTAAIFLATILTITDLYVGNAWTARHHLFFGIGASGARGMLSAIAGSMMTVASLTFSLTISTLATASTQYTSRLVRNFMRDNVNQFVLGYFVSLFAYCLIVLRTIRGGDEGQFVPSLAVMGGLILALISIAVLIYFIHHIAESIQAATILENVTAETLEAIEEIFPADLGDPAGRLTDAQSAIPAPQAAHRLPVPAKKFGYVQSVNTEELLAIGVEQDAVIHMTADIGAFVTPAGILCEIYSPQPLDDANAEELVRRLRAAFDLGSVRTIEQDAAFGIRQIVDIALKALSPGINDTTTGVMCVDHLAIVLETLAVRNIPERIRAKDGNVRVIASGRSFETLAALCLNQIRQNAAGNTAVLTGLLQAVTLAGRQTRDPNRLRVLATHAALIGTMAEKSIDAHADLQPIQALAQAAQADLAGN